MKSALANYVHPNPLVEEGGIHYLVLRLTPYGDDEYTNFCRLVAKEFHKKAYYEKGKQVETFGKELEAKIQDIEDELRTKAGPTPRKENVEEGEVSSGT